MKKYLALLALGSILMTSGYAVQPLKSQTTQSSIIQLTETESVPFETVSKGFYSGHQERKDYVIKNSDKWKTLWDKVYSTTTPTPSTPNIDFNNETIIAVFQGSYPTGGYSIEITGIVEKENYLEVLVKESSPEPGSITTQAFTQPYHIVKTKRADKDVIFSR